MSRSVAGPSWRLTPRVSKNSDEITGYQMTCLNAKHENCNKSLSNSVSGSKDMTERMLRAWIVWGQEAADKEQHKKIWGRVLLAKKRGTIPSLADLGAMGQARQPRRAADSASANPAKSAPARRVVGKSTDSAAAPGTPDTVAERMEAMMAEGSLPRTTQAQRARNRRTKGTEYGVPPALIEALQWGFISPNLPAPRGMVWVASGHKQFTLQYRGG